MKKQALIFIVLFCFWQQRLLFAQDYYLKTISITGTSSDNGLDIIADETGYVVMTGSMAFGAIGGVGIFKTDLWGDKIWENAVNYYPYDAGPRNICKLQNQNYLVSGGRVESGLSFQDLFLFINESGYLYQTVIHGDTMDNRPPNSILRDDKIIAYTSITAPGSGLSLFNRTLLLTLDTGGVLLRRDTLENIAGYPRNGSEAILLLPTQEYILGIGAQNEPNKIYGYLRKTDTTGNTIPPPDAGSGKNAQPPYPQIPLIDLKAANRLMVQPNPAREQVTISIPPFIAEKQTELYLYNTQGMAVQQIPVASGKYTLTLPTQDLPNGIYFLSLIAGGVRLAQTKLVVQH